MKNGSGTANAFDVAAIVIGAMRSVGVSPIPRNYHLFYEAYLGSTTSLTDDLRSLGGNPSQADLDEVAARHYGAGAGTILETVREQVSHELETIRGAIDKERLALERYQGVLTDAYDGLASFGGTTIEPLTRTVTRLTKATDDTINHGQRTVSKVDRSSEEINAIYRELERYREAANTDSLTGLNNRRAFDEHLAAVYDQRALLPLSTLILADVDHFKRVNDTYGHPVGDLVLTAIARRLRALAPRDSFVARVGGEEFAIVVNGRSSDEIVVLCGRMKSAIARQKFTAARIGLSVDSITISFGIAKASQAPGAEDLFRAADLALYKAKTDGRNRFVFFEEELLGEHRKDWWIYRK